MIVFNHWNILKDKSINKGFELPVKFIDKWKNLLNFTGEQDKEQSIMLFNLLTEVGLKLTQEILTAVFTRETGNRQNCY